MTIHPDQRRRALEAVGSARRNRHPYVAIRPKPLGGSDSAQTAGKVIDPNVRREPAFDAALTSAGDQWPGCSTWEVIGADNIADGMLMQPRGYGYFDAANEQENEEAVGDGPG